MRSLSLVNFAKTLLLLSKCGIALVVDAFDLLWLLWMNAVMIKGAFNSWIGIQILMSDNLKGRRTALSGHDGRTCQEKVPDSIETISILCSHFVFVLLPILVPSLNRGRVVDANYVGGADFKASRLKLVDDPAETARSCINV